MIKYLKKINVKYVTKFKHSEQSIVINVKNVFQNTIIIVFGLEDVLVN